MQIRCRTCGVFAEIKTSRAMAGRTLVCSCPNSGAVLRGRVEEDSRPVATVDCPDCGRTHYAFGDCPTHEVYQPRGFLQWELETAPGRTRE